MCRILEQLVLYLRALQMMAQSVTLAETEMKEERLQYVNSLKHGTCCTGGRIICNMGKWLQSFSKN